MAFIRWKVNVAGKRLAYLVHAYRGPDGKPKQKVLHYLGESHELTSKHIEILCQKHPLLKVEWAKIKPSARPMTDVSNLSDGNLLRKIRQLRHELGISQTHFPQYLRDHGLTPCSGSEATGYYLNGRDYGVLEKALESGEPQDFYLDPETEIAPALRRLFNRNA